MSLCPCATTFFWKFWELIGMQCHYYKLYKHMYTYSKRVKGKVFQHTFFPMSGVFSFKKISLRAALICFLKLIGGSAALQLLGTTYLIHTLTTTFWQITLLRKGWFNLPGSNQDSIFPPKIMSLNPFETAEMYYEDFLMQKAPICITLVLPNREHVKFWQRFFLNRTLTIIWPQLQCFDFLFGFSLWEPSL